MVRLQANLHKGMDWRRNRKEKRKHRRVKTFRLRKNLQNGMVRQITPLQNAKLKLRNFHLLHRRLKKTSNAPHRNLRIHQVQGTSKASLWIQWAKHFSVCLICITAFKRSYSRETRPKWSGRWMHLWSGRGCIDQRSRSGIRARTMRRSASSWARYGTSCPRSNSGRTLTKLLN